MKRIDLNNKTIVGAISLEEKDDYITPWRIDYVEKDFYTPNLLEGVAEIPAGVRIVFNTNSTKVKVEFAASQNTLAFDVVLNKKYLKTITTNPQDTAFILEGLPSSNNFVEIYLSQQAKVSIKAVSIELDADWGFDLSERKKWIAYGSSITQCREAESPSKTWPAIAANKLNLALTCLGFSGQCQYEPIIAQTIRDTPVDFISLCAGINTYGANCYNDRTFQASLIGFIKIIREKHTTVPIVLSSPIYGAFREETPNLVGYTLIEMRKQIKEVVDIFNNNGDQQLFYVDGLSIFSEAFAHLLPDDLHPNAEGYKIMGTNFARALDEYFTS